MKPTVTIIYNAVLAITSVLLLYSYFYVLVYDKDFFTEEAKQNLIKESSKKVNESNQDSSAIDKSLISNAEIASDSTKVDSSIASTIIAIAPKNPSITPGIQDSNLKQKEFEEIEKDVEHVNFLDMLVVMFLAGMLGGVLANLRGIFEFYREEKSFPENLFIPYLIRPLTAAISGLLIFFISHLIISSTANPTYDNEYISFRGMVSFMSLAIISGFASQEFTERLKAAAGTLFGISPAEASRRPEDPVIPETSNPTTPNPEVPNPTDDSDNSTSSSEETPEVTMPSANIPTTPTAPQAQQKMGKSRYMNRD
ncbi:hypothetical protein [Aquimarina litoralis]|uniref:hypothetical protein n=1 Tax=Aquimarina litoralis TaxID=584605 RepID=UPI001C57431A|nr:hypothetical protein [Aquimarina litoralis]MBW1294353.1 hypothetical protein [Aquimarina litoralis]